VIKIEEELGFLLKTKEAVIEKSEKGKNYSFTLIYRDTGNYHVFK
jgi:hypothetical protein